MSNTANTHISEADLDNEHKISFYSYPVYTAFQLGYVLTNNNHRFNNSLTCYTNTEKTAKSSQVSFDRYCYDKSSTACGYARFTACKAAT